MEERTITFEDVILYAEKVGCEHRPDESKAKDYSHQYFYNPWGNMPLMVVYEAPKRTLRGHEKPEVCWWCIDPYGRFHSVPSRHLRMMEQRPGFPLYEEGYDLMIRTMNNIQEAE